MLIIPMAVCNHFKIGLKTIGFDRIKAMESVLVLGVAGGSVIKH
jgi:hypothetical protein